MNPVTPGRYMTTFENPVIDLIYLQKSSTSLICILIKGSGVGIFFNISSSSFINFSFLRPTPFFYSSVEFCIIVINGSYAPGGLWANPNNLKYSESHSLPNQAFL